MEKYLFQSLLSREEKYRWFKARKEIILLMIKKYCEKKTSQAMKNKKILDVWCGTWYLLENLVNMWYKDSMWIDVDDEAIKICKKKWLNIAKMNLDELQNKGNEFDIITCTDVLEHIQDDKKSLKDMISLLNKNWLIILTVPAFMFLWWNHDTIHHHYRRYTKKNLLDKIEKSWGRVDFITYYNFFLFPLAILFKLINGKKRIVKENMNGTLNRILYNIFRLEKFFLGVKIKFPWWVSLIVVIGKK